jgi:hypothetical protein
MADASRARPIRPLVDQLTGNVEVPKQLQTSCRGKSSLGGEFLLPTDLQ